MSLAKEPYVPSPFTLTLLDNFGTRRLVHCPKANPTPSSNMSHHRSEARMRPAIDKQSLLEQLQKEKTKNRRMNASSSYLKRQLSHSKQITVPAAAAAPPPQRSIDVSLKRQLEAMVQKIEAQAQQIGRIKASKKYNRYIELLTAKQVYEEQLKVAAKRTTRNRQALRERKRMWREHRQREEDTETMDRAVRNRLMQENRALGGRIEEEDLKIREVLERKALQLRERNRLIRDILHLQKVTGKMLILQKEESSEENQEQAGPPKIFQKELKEEALQMAPECQQYDQFQQDSASQRESSSSHSSTTSKEKSKIPKQKLRRHNVSF